ncbi:MAG TPA: NfeD family protein [Pseudonocardia sp.]|jgi:membrane protein implicated in regulation of membrane protease activity|nr:NfeD family protein [Pseudonocardia sp.]
MSAAVIWLVLGLVLIAAEVLSGEFVLLMLGVAALVAAGASFAVAGVAVGAISFAVAAVVLVFAARPALRRRLDRGIEHSTMHTKALVGKTAVVVARVDGHGGRIRIGGELWSARASDGHEVIEPGAAVTVLDISGATALVVGRD